MKKPTPETYHHEMEAAHGIQLGKSIPNFLEQQPLQKQRHQLHFGAHVAGELLMKIKHVVVLLFAFQRFKEVDSHITFQVSHYLIRGDCRMVEQRAQCLLPHSLPVQRLMHSLSIVFVHFPVLEVGYKHRKILEVVIVGAEMEQQLLPVPRFEPEEYELVDRETLIVKDCILVSLLLHKFVKPVRVTRCGVLEVANLFLHLIAELTLQEVHRFQQQAVE